MTKLKTQIKLVCSLFKQLAYEKMSNFYQSQNAFTRTTIAADRTQGS